MQTKKKKKTIKEKKKTIKKKKKKTKVILKYEEGGCLT